MKNDIEQTRLMTFLDSCRDENSIDDVIAYIIKSNYQVEACWVRIYKNELGIPNVIDVEDEDGNYYCVYSEGLDEMRLNHII